MQVRNSFVHNDLEIVRPGWFVCSCCPTNVARLIPSVPGYIYATKGKDIYVNLYISGSVSLALEDKNTVQLTQQNNYPWDGNIRVTVSPKKSSDLTLMMRIPGYVVELVLPMEIRRVAANDKLKDEVGKVALQRGPILYCAEWADNEGTTSNLVLPDSSPLTAVFQTGLLNGVMTLQGNGRAVVIDPSGQQLSTKDQKIVAIPYYSRANRGKGEMNIWFPEKIKAVDLVSAIPLPVPIQQ